MANEQERSTFSHAPIGGYRAGQRSITNRRGISRFEMMRQRERAALRNRPFIIGALVFVLLVLMVPAYGFYQRYVVPPTEIAVQVEDKIYTRGDIVQLHPILPTTQRRPRRTLRTRNLRIRSNADPPI